MKLTHFAFPTLGNHADDPRTRVCVHSKQSRSWQTVPYFREFGLSNRSAAGLVSGVFGDVAMS